MTKTQRQLLLAYLGYYVGEIDGDWGTLSKTACKAFQKDFGGISVDGYGGPETDKALKHAVAYGMPVKNIQEEPKDENEPTKSFWDEIEYFTREEFRCKCGGLYCNGFPAEPDEQLVRYANEIRRRLGVPTSVNSGLRCKVWNQKNNGATASKHMTGLACDLGAPEGVTPEKMATLAEEVIGNTGGIGIYSWGIHIDSRSVKARWNG